MEHDQMKSEEGVEWRSEYNKLGESFSRRESQLERLLESQKEELSRQKIQIQKLSVELSRVRQERDNLKREVENERRRREEDLGKVRQDLLALQLLNQEVQKLNHF